MVRRQTKNQFKPGQSGNPSGRPKAEVVLRDLARTHSEEAITTLVSIMKGEMVQQKVKHVYFKDGELREREYLRTIIPGPSDRLRAIEILLDRGWGRPPQSLDISNRDGSLRAAWISAVGGSMNQLPAIPGMLQRDVSTTQHGH